MRKYLKDLLWLLSGGVEDTIRQRNALKDKLAAAQVEIAELQRRDAIATKGLTAYPVPFIMLNTMPKSGSVFLAESLRWGLGIPGRDISSGYTPVDLIDFRKLLDASQGRALAQAHLDANPTNLRLLKEYSPRMVLHLREPRQALLSWVHHVKSYAELGQLRFLMVTPAPPAELFEETLSASIDWHLVHHFPNLLRWMEQWLAHGESEESPKVLLTQYRELRENPRKTIACILDFYEIPSWVYTPREIPKDNSTHFRKGELDEWKKVFNPAQQQICEAMMVTHPRVWQLYGDVNSQVNGSTQHAKKLIIQPARNGHLAAPGR